MGSSEMIESGRIGGGGGGQKSTFAHTCSLLSQYLKENGSLGDLSLGLNRSFEPNDVVPAKTMNLLSMIERNSPEVTVPTARKIPAVPANLFLQKAGFGSAFPKEDAQKKADKSAVRSEPETAPMTIFYGGQVIVFNDFPADKAKEIMLLASKEISSQNSVNTFTTNMIPRHTFPSVAHSVAPARSFVQSSFGSNLVPDIVERPPFHPNVNDLPIARKASLTRFLEKRKNRIIAKAPYPVGAASNKPVESKAAWMGFGAQYAVQMERH